MLGLSKWWPRQAAEPQPVNNALDLGPEVVDLVYETMLGRTPDDAARANCVAFFGAGGSIADLRRAIEGSDEYQGKVKAASARHPLAHIEAAWRPHRTPYHTYRGQFRPLSLMIETVNICNNDCIICPYSSQTRRRQMMSMDVFMEAIAQYDEVGGGPLGLTPMVGEIFLDKHLLKRLEFVKAHRSISEVSAISNASMVHLYSDEELAHLLSYFDRIAISIYGLDRDEFLTMTRKDGYERFFTGLSRILRLAGRTKVLLTARQLVSRSAEDIDSWLKSLADAAGLTTAPTMTSTMEFSNWSFFDTAQPLPGDARWSAPRQNTAQCALPLISAQILSDGTTSFCGCANFDGVSELNLGNIMSTRLAEMMTSERVKRLWNWQEYGVPDFCKSCTFHMPITQLRDNDSAFSDPLGTFGG